MRAIRRDRPRKYHWTEVLRGRVREAYRAQSRAQLTARLDALVHTTGWPRHAFTGEAERMGLTTGARRWTVQEDECLRERLGTVSVRTIARGLRRSAAAVESRAQHLGLSRRWREGYNIDDLAGCFGVDPHKVARWFARGLFGKVHATGGANGRRVAEANVIRFIRRHHSEYDLRRVDQTWFTAMVFEGAYAGTTERV